jgi:undecaprenyl-diphosphatase
VSSSGHLALVPRLLGWTYAELPAAERKSFEVALHAGSGAALAWLMRGELRSIARDPAGTLLAFAPAAAVGFALERPIEQRFGGELSVAVAQIAAGALLLLSDRSPEARSGATAADHLAVGFAQAAALVPGISRAGAALTAARLRGLDRSAAFRLSLRAALPITLGAALLKTARAIGDPPAAPVAAGALAAAGSTLAARGLLGRMERSRGYGGLAAYRIALGTAVLARGVVRSRA